MIITKIIKITALCFALILVLLTAWCFYQYFSITAIGEETSPEMADVIIVLGAAVWSGGPSPALSARIEHALYVYNQSYAKNFILSGGLGNHPPTEAEAMMQELVRQGVGHNALFKEERSRNTIENLRFSKGIMDEQGFASAIIVTDPFHMKRSLLIARDLGITVTGAPAKNSVLYTNEDLRLRYTLREVLAISWYYFERIF